MHKKDRREKFDIIYEILAILSDGNAYKTMLAHKAKLDSRTIDKYISLLQRVNLITVEKEREEGGRYILRITEKGRTFINLYEELTRLVRT